MLPRMACPACLPCLFCPVCSLLKEKRIKAGAHMKQLSQKMRQQRLQVGGGEGGWVGRAARKMFACVESQLIAGLLAADNKGQACC